MIEVKSGDTTLRLRASTMALIYFQQEFKEELTKELGNVLKGIFGMIAGNGKRPWIANINGVKLDLNLLGVTEEFQSIPLLKIMWAMNKAQNKAEGINVTPKFEQWLEQIDELNLFDVCVEVANEAVSGFFPSAGQATGGNGKEGKAEKQSVGHDDTGAVAADGTEV